jgi:hypothetical protein
MNEIDNFKHFELYSGDVTASVDDMHVKSAFSLPLTHQRSSNMLQHPAYNPSASVFSFLISTTVPGFNILEFIFWTTNLTK